jgi:hypothetical protein
MFWRAWRNDSFLLVLAMFVPVARTRARTDDTLPGFRALSGLQCTPPRCRDMIDSKLQSESQWVIEVKSLTTKTKHAPDGTLRQYGHGLVVVPGGPPDGVGPGRGARPEPELFSDGSAALGS